MSRIAESEVFVAVVQKQGVSAAARSLGCSKSAVSKAVRALEERLGVRLLQRSTRSLALTPEGRTFYERASVALDGLREAEAVVAGGDGPLVGPVRMSLPTTFGVRYLAPAIAAFMAQHPRVEIDAQFTDRKVDLVDEGFDLAVRGGRLEPSSLVARKLAPITLVIAASPEFLARHPIQSPDDLAALPAMAYRQPTSAPTLRLTNRAGETRDLRQAGPLSSDNGDMLLAAAREGLGYLIQPDFLVADDVRSGRLVRVLSDWQGPDAAMWVVYPHRSLLSARVRAFVDFLLERLREPEWCLGAG